MDGRDVKRGISVAMIVLQVVCLILLILLFAIKGHAQNQNNLNGSDVGFSITKVGELSSLGAIDGWVASVTDGNSSTDCTVGGGSTNVLCIYNASTWSALGGGGGSNNPGSPGYSTQCANSGVTAFVGIALGTAGQVLESNGAGGCASFQDPIVSGPDAPGAVPTKNPVQMGSFDGTDVQRVSSDSSGHLNVNAVLGAETTKVIGTVNQGTSPWVVSSAQLPAALDGSGFFKSHEQGIAQVAPTTGANTVSNPFFHQISDGTHGVTINSTTYTSKYGLDINILGTLGTAFSTPGFVDVKGADGNIFVRQTTGSNLHVDVDTALPAGTNLMGKVGIDQTTLGTTNGITPVPATASAAAVTACNILTTASTNATNCKGSAGNFYGFEVFNTTTTVYYLRLYNASSGPTCSSATGFIRTIPIPPASASGLVGGAISNQTFPVNYGTGIGYCITGGSTSTDNTNAAAGIFGEIRYD